MHHILGHVIQQDIETKTLAIFLHCRSNFICLLCSYPRKLTNIFCNIFARKFCNVGWKVVRWSRDASAPVSDDQALTKPYLNLSIFPNINSIYLNANPLRITHRNKTLLLSTRNHYLLMTYLALMMRSWTLVMLSLSMMRLTPGLGPRKVMTLSLWYQVMEGGGSGVHWIMQVMLITLPLST